MARPLRIEFAGAWYHVMNRGAARRTVFNTDTHRHYFLSLLAETSARFNAEWHAYCLMSNHYHLLLRTPEGNLQKIMRHINGLYTQYFNRTEGRDGPLFRGRYKAILVDEQAYWSQLSRYIHRNPLEAGLVKRLEQYHWSSYRSYVGKDKRPLWLHCDYILKAIAGRNRREHYRAYVAEGTDPDLVNFYAGKKQAPVLGGDAFREALALEQENIDLPELRQIRSKPDLDKLVEAVCRRLKVKPETIWRSARGRGAGNPARGMVMYLCQQMSDMPLREIADRFNLKSYASAGSGIRQFTKRLAMDKELQKKINLIKLDLTP